MHENRLIIGALYIISAEFMFVSMGASIRQVSGELNNPMIVFARNMAGLLFILPVLLRHGIDSLETKVPHLHLLRGLAGVSAMYCFYYAIAHMPMANAMLLKLSAPLFIPLIAFVWLKELIGWRVALAIGVGFTGVAIILTPDLSNMNTVALIALSGGVFAALAKVTVRRLSRTEKSSLTVFYFALTGLVISLIPLYWFWQTPSLEATLWLITLGLFATMGQLLMTHGMAHAPAGQLGPFTFFAVIFGAIFGWLFWNESLTITTLIGAILILISALINALSKKTNHASLAPSA